MTLVVGVNLGYYALFAGDSRETFFSPDQPDLTTREDFKKIIQTPIGLATGSGLTKVVFEVIKELSGHPVEMSDSEEVARFMRDFLEGFMSTAPTHVTDPRVIPMLNQVGWIFSSVEESAIQLRLYHSQHDFEPMYYPKGRPCSLLPIDLTPELSEPAEHQLMNSLRICRKSGDLDSSLQHNLSAIANYFKRQRKISAHIGAAIQVRYQTISREIEITEIMALSDFG